MNGEDNFFRTKYCWKHLDSSRISCEFGNTCFRSIFWKIRLKYLPEDSELWIDASKSHREIYELISDKLKTNPREAESLDVSINNPLSLSNQNPWNQYFQDCELKMIIKQDVVRTFPEIPFFQSLPIQNMMTKILFSYAREYPHISYKQGMHELVAPVIFVLHEDSKVFWCQSVQNSTKSQELEILFDQNYLEHDSFFLFCKLMDIVGPWYLSNDCLSSKYEFPINMEPFTESPCMDCANSLEPKLKSIFENILKQKDIELYTCLQNLEITPQMFGIRWLRLLFGREFLMPELLSVWDAIFADSDHCSLIDYMFVAMLISIRIYILQGCYSTCLKYLMHFPKNIRANCVISLAMELRDSKIYCVNGTDLSRNNGFTVQNTSQECPSEAAVTSGKGETNSSSKNRPKSLSITAMSLLRSTISLPASEGVRGKSASMSECTSASSSTLPKDSGSDEESHDYPLVDLSGPETFRSQLKQLQLKNKQWSTEMSFHLTVLEESIPPDLMQDTKISSALLELKKIRDSLKGSTDFEDGD